MAQAKTRSRATGARTKSSNGNRSSASSSRARSARSGSNSGKTRSNSSSKSSASKRSAGKSRSTSRSRSPQSAQAKTAQPKSFLDKAKTPLVAGGAALLGVAGGAVAARNSKKRRSFPTLNLKKLPSPKELMPKGDALGWIEGKAKTMGDASQRVAELSSDAQKIKKSIEK